MATPAQVLKDPNFLALPVEERRKVLTALDPNFGMLPKVEQDKVFGVNTSANATEPKEEPGVLERGWNAFKDWTPPAPASDWPSFGPQFREQLSCLLHGVAGIVPQTNAALQQTGNAILQGNPIDALRAAPGIVPVVGPMTQQIGQDVTTGNYPEATGHLLNLGAQAFVPKLLGGPDMVDPVETSVPKVPKTPGPVSRFLNNVQANRSNPATQDAIIGQIPIIGKKFKAINDSFPKPPEPIPPRMNWPPSAELPRSQPIRPGAPPPSAALPRANQPSTGAPRPNWPPSAALPRLPVTEEEAIASRFNPTAEQIQAEIDKLQPQSFTPTQVPPPPAGAYSVKPGEGTHLDMSHVKPGELPVKADYQTGARNLWATNMARELKGMSAEDAAKMTDEEWKASAKKAAVGPPSPEKIKILLKLLGGK